MQLSILVEASHATNAITWKLYSGVVIFNSRVSIIWSLILQNTIELVDFSSGYMVLYCRMESKISCHYKLKILGVQNMVPKIHIQKIRVWCLMPWCKNIHWRRDTIQSTINWSCGPQQHRIWDWTLMREKITW